MEGFAPSRALSTEVAAARIGRPAPAPRVLGPYVVGQATEADDPDIRRLLRETVFPGQVQVAFEREPDSLAAARVEGDVHQTIVARVAATGQAAAIASRSERQRFLNGNPSRVGYLGLLRFDRGFRRHPQLLRAGFDFCRSLHEAGAASLYLASVVGDNTQAMRLLGRRRPGGPMFRPVAPLVTLMIPVRGLRQSDGTDVRVITAVESQLPAIVDCLERNNRRYQAAPRWTRAELVSLGAVSGLAVDDFVVAGRDGHVVGCAACWDQRGFRQIRVRGYSRLLSSARPMINAAAAVTGGTRLPNVGARIEVGYASHLAVDDDEPATAVRLLEAVARKAVAKGLEYVALGLPDGHSLTRAIRRAFRHWSYASVLHIGYWPDGRAAAAALDGRPYLPELAVL